MKLIFIILIEALIFVLLIPIFIYILFFYLENNDIHAFFWAIIVGIGNLMLLFFSPKFKIIEGVKMLGVFSWMGIIAFSLLPFISISDNKTINHISESFSLFLTFIGLSVFQKRIMKQLTKKG